jgi:predicted AlkP superfamily phosphohydrolase/phosphomutase
MLRSGELPTFRRLIDEGAWGSFLTYGQASSPMVWTSMATGKRVRDHGINDFVTKSDAGYGVAPMKSYDRHARAIWNILGDFGFRVGVIDWLITYPPEEVNGYIVSRLHLDEPNRTYPPALNGDVEAIRAEVTDYGDADRTKNFGQIDHVFETAELLLDREPLDFLALFEGVSDWVEHRYWKYYEPDRFAPELWSYSPGEVREFGSIIPETYAHLDRRLGELMQRLDDDALLLVVSDHGQKAVPGRQVWLRVDRLLEALGYAELEGEGEEAVVVHAGSRAYAATETPWAPLIGVNVNVRGREPEGIVDPADAEAVARELEAALRAVRFEDGTPLFGAIGAPGEAAAGSVAGQSDIVITHSRFTRSDRYSQETILVGERRYRLDDFMEADVKISGGHDHQGVIFVHGRCVRPGPIGQLTVTTPLQEVLWHVTDKIDAVDPWLPVLGRLGIIERGTTLDVTPTVLYALGLPVADDMAGKPLASRIRTGQEPTTIASYETDAGGNLRAVDVESDEDMMKRLKALGYIN